MGRAAKPDAAQEQAGQSQRQRRRGRQLSFAYPKLSRERAVFLVVCVFVLKISTSAEVSPEIDRELLMM